MIHEAKNVLELRVNILDDTRQITKNFECKNKHMFKDGGKDISP
jgi:hypothetical protein